MRRLPSICFALAVLAIVLPAAGCSDKAEDPIQQECRLFLQEFEGRIAPMSRDMALAFFESSVSGRPEDYARSAELQLAVDKLYADRDVFKRLDAWKESGKVTDTLLARQLGLLHDAFRRNQIEPALLEDMVARQSALEERYNTFRATLDGRSVTDNELEAVLRESVDSAQLERAWRASKAIGALVADDIVALVRLRNEAAKEAGFANFHRMQLLLDEQDPAEMDRLFDELDELSREPFRVAKAEIDGFLAQRLGVAETGLRPWHYQNRFFQEAPRIYPVDLDGYYADRDLVALTRDYYEGIGLPVDDVIAASDLYEKPGKYQHAFCEDIDRSGDVRVLCSVQPDNYWMNTLLHEFGHAVYAKYNDPGLPWLLRDSAHALTTEAVAQIFGRFATDPAWLRDVVGISEEERAGIAEATYASQRLEQLVASRWFQVMYRFEKSLYENPDQDLNGLWWDLVERYQMLHRPAESGGADWAAKIHIALYPAYYHNYQLGEMLASQLYAHIAGEVLGAAEPRGQSFAGRPEVGAYMIGKIFHPGRKLPWNEMIREATGEPLTARHYARQFFGGE